MKNLALAFGVLINLLVLPFNLACEDDFQQPAGDHAPLQRDAGPPDALASLDPADLPSLPRPDLLNKFTALRTDWLDALPLSNCPRQFSQDPNDDLKWSGYFAERANKIRAKLGIPCLKADQELTRAAVNHSSYIVINWDKRWCWEDPDGGGPGGHYEFPVSDCYSYTGLHPSTRVEVAGYTGDWEGEGIAYMGDNDQVVVQLMNAIFHRSTIYQSSADDIGSAWRMAGEANHKHAHTIETGSRRPARMDQPIAFPFNGMTKVDRAWDGKEDPDPPAPPQGWPSGYPVTFYEPGVSYSAHECFQRNAFSSFTGTGDVIATYIIGTWNSSGQLIPGEYVIVPNKPLNAEKNYTCRLAGFVGVQNHPYGPHGTPVHRSVTFTTGTQLGSNLD